MKRFLQVLGLLFLVLAIIVIARTLVAPSRQIDRIAHTAEGIDAQRAARDLAGLIPFRTISYEGGETEEQKRETQQAFEGLHAYMRHSRVSTKHLRLNMLAHTTCCLFGRVLTPR